MCLQKPRFPAAHDLSLAAYIFPVSLLKTTKSRLQTQRLCPWPASSPVSCAPPTKTYYYIQEAGWFGEVFLRFQIFCLWKGISICKVSFLLGILKELLNNGMLNFRYLLQRRGPALGGNASPSRNFSSSRSSAFRFSSLFSSWIFPSRSFSSSLSQPYLIYELIL